MKSSRFVSLITFILSLILAASLFAQEEKKINKTFDKKNRIRIKLVLGDCNIKKSNDNKIHVNLVYSYSDENFEAIFRERSSYIELREKFHGDNDRGESRWTISIPEGVDIDFKSATGGISIEKVNAEIDGNTGTGDIEIMDASGQYDLSSGTGRVDISDSKGEFDLSSGTGRVEVGNSEGEFDLRSGTGNVMIEDSKGNFNLSSGTGDVEANNITIEDDGEFSSGTGDAEVISPNGENYDLTVSSGTNDATLDMNGKSIEGYFEFTCQERRGRIDCPIKFDDEEKYERNNHNTYLRKSFTKGKKSTRYYIKTGTGKAKLKR